MSKPILPKYLRLKISSLYKDGHLKSGILDIVADEAKDYVESIDQLWRCICSIAKKESNRKNAPRSFDSSKYQSIINGLSKDMSEKIFENACTEVVIDILVNYEGFEGINDANKATGFTNPPFDFFGCKSGSPYIIEFKGSLSQFNGPSKYQIQRQEKLLDRVKGLKVALLQVKLKSAEYRILYNEEIGDCYSGHEMPMEPIEKWLKIQIGNMKS